MRTRGKTIIAAAAAALLLLGGAVTPAQSATKPAGAIQPMSSYAGVVDFALSPDGSTAYVTTEERGVDVVDTATGKRKARIDMAARADLALSPDGRVLVAGNWYPNAGHRVHVISTATKKIVRTIAPKATRGQGSSMIFGPSGVGVYLTNSTTVQILNTRTGAVRTLMTFPRFSVDWPSDVLPTSDGRRLYVIDTSPMDGKPRLWAINAKTGEIGKRIDLWKVGSPVVGAGASFSKNGKALYIPAGDIDGLVRLLVYRIPEATLARTIELGDLGSPEAVVASNDARSLFVADLPNGGVSKIVASSGVVTDQQPVGKWLREIEISGDGSTLAVIDISADDLDDIRYEDVLLRFLETGE